MHNHVAIEPVKYVLGFIDWSTVRRIRDILYDAVKMSNAPGLIITSVIHFDRWQDKMYLSEIMDQFEDYEMSCLELTAPEEVRLERASSANRLKFKPSQRDIESSRRRIIAENRDHRTLSCAGELFFDKHLRVDTASLSAEEVAERAIEELGLLLPEKDCE